MSSIHHKWLLIVAPCALLACSSGGESAPEPTKPLFEDISHRCGNGSCDHKETCSTCPSDCGACPGAGGGSAGAGGQSGAGGSGGEAPGSYGPESDIACPAGAVDIVPGQDIAAIVSAAAPGTSFCIHAGTYYPTSPINPKSNDILTGEYGAVIDGTNVTMDYDVGSTSIVRGWNCTGCENVTVRNLVIRNLTDHICIGVYNGGDGWTIDHNEVSGCHHGIDMGKGAHVTNNYVHDNFSFAVGGYLATDDVIDHNEIAYSGGLPDQGGSTACTKWAGNTSGISNLTITNNYVHDCNTTGLWLDGSGAGNTLAYNRIENNVRGGVEWEVSLGGSLHHNTFSGNGVAVFVSNSQDVEVYSNTITQNDGFALQLFVDASRLDITNDTFHDNQVDLSGHPASLAVGLTCINTSSCSSFGTPHGNGFDANAYATGGRAGSAFWVWGDGPLDFSQWQSIPEDAHGTAE